MSHIIQKRYKLVQNLSMQFNDGDYFNGVRLKTHLIQSRDDFATIVAPIIDKLMSVHSHTAFDNNHSICGLDCEGSPDLSRTGKIVVLQLSVAREEEYIDVFLIDPLLAGDEIIAVDLKPLLESTRVIKVIHDGRRDCEALWYQYGIQLTCVLDTQMAYEQLQLKNILEIGQNNDRLTAALARLEGSLSKIADFCENDTERDAALELIQKQFSDFGKEKSYISSCAKMIVDKARLNRAFGKRKTFLDHSPQQKFAEICSKIKNSGVDGTEEFLSSLTAYIETTSRRLEVPTTPLQILSPSSTKLEHIAHQSFLRHVSESDARFITCLLFEGILSRKKYIKIVDGIIGDLKHQSHRIVAILETVVNHANGIELFGRSNFDKIVKKLHERMDQVENAEKVKQLLEKAKSNSPKSPSSPTRWSSSLNEKSSPISSMHFPALPKVTYSPGGQSFQGDVPPCPFATLFAPVSYVVELSELCDVDYGSKYETRSEQRSAGDYWTRRPLSEPMLLSAALDAFFLLPLYEVLRLLLVRSHMQRDAVIELLQRCQIYVESFRDHAQEDTEEEKTNTNDQFTFSDWNIIPTMSSGSLDQDVILRVIRIEDGTISRVIGRKGSTINNLRTHVLNVSMYTCTGYSKLFLIGTRAAVTRATLLIPKKSTIIVASNLVDRFDHATLLRLTKKTKCKIMVGNYVQGTFLEIILFGDDAATKKAIDAISKITLDSSLPTNDIPKHT